MTQPTGQPEPIRNYSTSHPIALFDVDGTLLGFDDRLNKPMANVLKALKAAGWVIRVHSGGGRQYAEQRMRHLCLSEFVDSCHSKTERVVADVSFDDEAVDFCPVNVKIRNDRMTKPTEQAQGWRESESKLMDFECIDHKSGTIDGSSMAYDEMMEYMNLKLEAQGRSMTTNTTVTGTSIDSGPRNFRHYRIKTWQEDVYWLAEIRNVKDKSLGMTQGRSEEELYEIIGDWFMTFNEVKVSWWNRMISRLKRFR